MCLRVSVVFVNILVCNGNLLMYLEICVLVYIVGS